MCDVYRHDEAHGFSTDVDGDTATCDSDVFEATMCKVFPG